MATVVLGLLPAKEWLKSGYHFSGRITGSPLALPILSHHTSSMPTDGSTTNTVKSHLYDNEQQFREQECRTSMCPRHCYELVVLGREMKAVGNLTCFPWHCTSLVVVDDPDNTIHTLLYLQKYHL